MIRVCDAIPGTGKSQSTIRYINEHPGEKFIYITPYLDEANRIKEGCPDAHFIEPQRTYKHDWSKLSHTQSLILKGENIATTHQAFKNYTEDMLIAIKEHGYTLFIDENCDILECCDFDSDDIQLVVDAGYVKEEDGVYTVVKKDYNGKCFKEMFWLFKSRQIIRIDFTDAENNTHHKYYYWTLPPDLVTSFKDVFILTYMFEGQSLYSFLKMYNLDFEYVGVNKLPDGGFCFGDAPGYRPEYVSHLGDMIEIIDDERLNAIGNDPFALSKSWFSRCNHDCIKQLKNNIYNIFNNVWDASIGRDRMWATFKTQKENLKGKGYTNGYSVINLRATNEFRDKLYLAYVCNLFMKVEEKMFYVKHGIEIDDDLYALSTMLQWIWRSGIRDGQKIHIYLPSSRMRRILTDWINQVSEGGGTVAGNVMC